VNAPPATAGWRVALAILVTLTCWLAFDPAPPTAANTGWDKANHALAFVVLTLCARRAFPAAPLALLACAGVAFGGFIEIVQLFVPGRSAEWSDLAADAVGIALALLPHALRRRP
jgi:VanZ family protein